MSRAVGITAPRASQWRDRFLAAGQASLKSRPPDARNEDDRRLQAKIGELLMENDELLWRWCADSARWASSGRLPRMTVRPSVACA